MNKSLFSIIGFILFILGGVSIVLTLVGLNLKFLGFLENFGTGLAFLIKLLIMIFGLIIVYLGRTTIED